MKRAILIGVLLVIEVLTLRGRVQQDPVQSVEQLGIVRSELGVRIVLFAVIQGRSTAVHDVWERGLDELPARDALDSLAQTGRETVQDVLNQHPLKRLQEKKQGIKIALGCPTLV